MYTNKVWVRRAKTPPPLPSWASLLRALFYRPSSFLELEAGWEKTVLEVTGHETWGSGRAVQFPSPLLYLCCKKSTLTYHLTLIPKPGRVRVQVMLLLFAQYSGNSPLPPYDHGEKICLKLRSLALLIESLCPLHQTIHLFNYSNHVRCFLKSLLWLSFHALRHPTQML